MDYSALTTLISSVGFPIVACIALFMQNSKQEIQHREEMNELKNVIENNTLILKELSVKFDTQRGQ